MNSPLRTYKENIDKRPGMKTEAYPYFFQKYFKDPYDTANDGIFDTSERVNAKAFPIFIPGKIYTFNYSPEGKDFLDYYDKRPIILCCGQWNAGTTGNKIVTGINFNFLPEIARVNTLEYYYRSVENDINLAYEQTQKNNQVSFIKRAIVVLQDIVKTFNIFNRAGQIGYQFAQRNYIIDSSHMRQVSLVEYDDWEWIPFIQTKEIVGKSLAEIYREYISQKNLLARKQPPIILDPNKRIYRNR